MYQFKNNKDFGIEIEFLRPDGYTQRFIARRLNTALNIHGQSCVVEGYNHITRPHWKIVGDSSVSGGTYNRQRFLGSNELVSPRLKGEDGKKQLKAVLRVLVGLHCRVNVTCGIHVHHDVTDTMVKDRKSVKVFLNNLIRFMSKFEHIIYRTLSPSRLTRGWSTPAKKIFGRFGDRRTDINTSVRKRVQMTISRFVNDNVDPKHERYGRGLASTSPSATRYCGLNLKNIWTRGSVEFRYMQGSLNFEKIWSWVVFTQAIINVTEVANKVSFTGIKNDLSGIFHLRKAVGFIGSKERCEDTKMANKVLLNNYKKFSAPNYDRTRNNHSESYYIRAGI